MSYLCFNEESGYSEENTCDNEVLRSTILHHRGKHTQASTVHLSHTVLR